MILNTGPWNVMLTVRFDACESLLWIASDSVIVQQSIGVEFRFWKGLQGWFQFHTFLSILQVLFLVFLQPLPLISCALTCICNMQCIRSRIMLWIFAHQCHGVWFDPPLKACLIYQKSNLFAHGMLYMSLMLIMMMIKS